jgi:hypothetical protein
MIKEKKFFFYILLKVERWAGKFCERRPEGSGVRTVSYLVGRCRRSCVGQEAEKAAKAGSGGRRSARQRRGVGKRLRPTWLNRYVDM